MSFRESSAESERESREMQKSWSEVRFMVRYIYRQTGTPLADDQDQPQDRDKEGMRGLVDRYQIPNLSASSILTVLSERCFWLFFRTWFAFFFCYVLKSPVTM